MGVETKRTHKGKSLLLFPEDYTVVDIETTGFDPMFDEIIEVAGIKYRGRNEVGRFQSLVKPDDGIPDYITALTGITNEMVTDAPGIEDVLPRFLEFIGEDIVVGHNVHFDVNFLYDYAEDFELKPFSNDLVDTLRLSRRLYPELQSHKLSALAAHFGVEPDGEHRALADCVTTQKCLSAMDAYAAQNGGIPESAEDLYRKLSKTIVAETSDFDPDSLIYGRTFAFTGKLERMTRKEAMQAVVNAGGHCTDGVVAETNYLVLGNNDYCKAIKDGKSAKQKKAEKMKLNGADIESISESVFCDMLGV
jgi:exonuclease, DNA polymerase III, epsilon subunit family